MSFVAVAVGGNGDALVITENCNPIRKPVPIHVDESGTEKADCSVNVGEWEADIDGKARGDAAGDGGEDFFVHGYRLGEVRKRVKEKINYF